MAGVRTEWVAYESDGATISAYLALPDRDGQWPGVVLVHEGSGLSEHRQDVARVLASEGYAVMAPNLFSRIGGRPPRAGTELERHQEIGVALRDEQVAQDLTAGHEYLCSRSETLVKKVGLIGFHMGGSKALFTACVTRR